MGWFHPENTTCDCFYCSRFTDADDYARGYWGGADCPACGVTLDDSGKNHVNGKTCEENDQHL